MSSVTRDKRAAAQLEWVKPTLQARSQHTLERLLDAAETIVIAEGIDAVTVSRVAREAGSSVGAFYARFADKDALVRCVFERFCDQAVATARAVMDPARWRDVPLEEALETMLQFMLRMLHERRLLITALLHGSSRDPALTALGHRLHRVITEALVTMLDERDSNLAHPDPATGLSMAVWLVISLTESRVLLGTHGVPPVADDVASREMARMVIRYLGVTEVRDERTENTRRERTAEV
jgi:AcrR family transcriptional regulator